MYGFTKHLNHLNCFHVIFCSLSQELTLSYHALTFDVCQTLTEFRRHSFNPTESFSRNYFAHQAKTYHSLLLLQFDVGQTSNSAAIHSSPLNRFHVIFCSFCQDYSTALFDSCINWTLARLWEKVRQHFSRPAEDVSRNSFVDFAGFTGFT